MTIWFLAFMFATALGPSMLAVGMRVGRQRTVATLAQMLERGSFRLVSPAGQPMSVKELSTALDAESVRPTLAPGRQMFAIAIAAACLAALLAFLVFSSRH